MKLVINSTDLSTISTAVYFPKGQDSKFLPSWSYTAEIPVDYDKGESVEMQTDLGNPYELEQIEGIDSEISFTSTWRGLEYGIEVSNTGREIVYLRDPRIVGRDLKCGGRIETNTVSDLYAFIESESLNPPTPIISLENFIESPIELIETWDDDVYYSEGTLVYHNGAIWKKIGNEDNDSEPAEGSNNWEVYIKENYRYDYSGSSFKIERIEKEGGSYFYWLPLDMGSFVFPSYLYYKTEENEYYIYSSFSESRLVFDVYDYLYAKFKNQNKYYGIDNDRYYAYLNSLIFTRIYLDWTDTDDQSGNYKSNEIKYHGSQENLVNIPGSTVLDNFAEYDFSFLVSKYPFNRDLKIQRLDERSYKVISGGETNWREDDECACYNSESLSALENVLFPTDSKSENEDTSFIEFRNSFFGSTQIGDKTLYLLNVPGDIRKVELYDSVIVDDRVEDYDYRVLYDQDLEKKPSLSIYFGPEFEWEQTEAGNYIENTKPEENVEEVSQKVYVKSLDEIDSECSKVVWIILTENNIGETINISYGLVVRDKVMPFRNKNEYTLRNDEYYGTKDSMGVVSEKGKILLDDRSNTILSTEKIDTHPILTKKLRKFGLSYYQADQTYQPGDKVRYKGKTWKTAELIPAYSQDIDWESLDLGGVSPSFDDIEVVRKGWRTLEYDELVYLLQQREASTVEGVDNARFFNCTVNDVKGVMILPDVFEEPAGFIIEPPLINNPGERAELFSLDESQFSIFENLGCIFLPAAGWKRYGQRVMDVGDSACYWTTTNNNQGSSFVFCLFSSFQNHIGEKSSGFCVRPVSDNNEDGLFSIGQGRKCLIAKGNLQYHCLNSTWRFAPTQYSYIGEDNVNASPSYNGWIDLFGYGTSGWDSECLSYQPYSNNSDPTTYINQNLLDEYENADWGVYATKLGYLPSEIDESYYYETEDGNAYTYKDGTWYSYYQIDSEPREDSEYWEEVYPIYSPFCIYNLGERVLYNSQVWESLCKDNIGNQPDYSKQWIPVSSADNFHTTRISILANPSNSGSIIPGGNNVVIGRNVRSIAFNIRPYLGWALDTENPCSSEYGNPLSEGFYDIYDDNVVVVRSGAWEELERSRKLIFNFIGRNLLMKILVMFSDSLRPEAYTGRIEKYGETIYISGSYNSDNYSILPADSEGNISSSVIPALRDNTLKMKIQDLYGDSLEKCRLSKVGYTRKNEYGETVTGFLDIEDGIAQDNVNFSEVTYTFYIEKVALRINCVIGLEEFELEDNMIEYSFGDTGYFRFYPREEMENQNIKVYMYPSVEDANIEDPHLAYDSIVMPSNLGEETESKNTMEQTENGYYSTCIARKLNHHYSFGDQVYYELEFTDIQKEIIIDIEYETQQ